MRQDEVTLKSLEFKGGNYAIAAVKCNLSNGQSSPLYENSLNGFNYQNAQTINLDNNKRIVTVGVAENK